MTIVEVAFAGGLCLLALGMMLLLGGMFYGGT